MSPSTVYKYLHFVTGDIRCNSISHFNTVVGYQKNYFELKTTIFYLQKKLCSIRICLNTFGCYNNIFKCLCNLFNTFPPFYFNRVFSSYKWNVILCSTIRETTLNIIMIFASTKKKRNCILEFLSTSNIVEKSTTFKLFGNRYDNRLLYSVWFCNYDLAPLIRNKKCTLRWNTTLDNDMIIHYSFNSHVHYFYLRFL